MTKERYAIQLIIEDKDYRGWDLGESFIEDVEELLLAENKRISLISSASWRVKND